MNLQEQEQISTMQELPKDSLILNIFVEEGNQKISLLIGIINVTSCCSLAKKLHEAALHHEPDEPGQVEDQGQEHQVDWHPLVVRVVHYGHLVL